MLDNQSWGWIWAPGELGLALFLCCRTWDRTWLGVWVLVAWVDCLILSWVILLACSFFNAFSWCFLMSFLFLVLWFLSLIPWSLFFGLLAGSSLILDPWSLIFNSFAHLSEELDIRRSRPTASPIPLYGSLWPSIFSWSIIYPHSRTIKVWAGGSIDLSDLHPTSMIWNPPVSASIPLKMMDYTS